MVWNLGAAGVSVDQQGFVLTNAKLQSNNKRIFAAGDCTARQQFTHHADAQARALIQNALFAPTASVDALVVPHCTYTDPEVASVGANQTVWKSQLSRLTDLSLTLASWTARGGSR